MIEAKVKVRKWGNSLGIAIPKDVVEGMHLKQGKEITVLLVEKVEFNPLEKMWGTAKFKQSAQEAMREIDRELYDD